jgi:hypothetical protein
VNADQLRLLGELADWQLLDLVEAWGDACAYIRDRHEYGTPRDQQWRAMSLMRATYRWGIAITTHGDYTKQRGIRDPEHVVTLTWGQLAEWSTTLPVDLRADARRARAGTPEERAQVVDRLLGRHQAPAEVEELTLW